MQEQQLATIAASFQFQTELYNHTSRISVSIRFLHVTSAIDIVAATIKNTSKT